MSVMLYKEGRGTRVWGKEYQTKVVSDSDVAEHLAAGWHKHPDDVAAAEVKAEPVKRTRKTKAESDESDDKG
ncbi:hypothetical protein [Nissabacter archeti]|uniref:hypothetical protein n=1 Tax=Nissabacter archeti TaxID=1917880 RepID=UPI0009344580|nr:hypothetical protein [Nissabacter archeti]